MEQQTAMQDLLHGYTRNAIATGHRIKDVQHDSMVERTDRTAEFEDEALERVVDRSSTHEIAN